MREIKKLYGRDVDDLMADNFNYQSPIEIMYSQFNTQIENQIMKAVQNIGVNVDKDELVRALEYDRKQYEKGFADALKCKPGEIAVVRHGKWEECITPNTFDTCGNPDTYMQCSVCGFAWNDKYAVKKYFKGCPNCTAKMDME